LSLKRNQSQAQQAVSWSQILAKILLVAVTLLFVCAIQKPETSGTHSSLKKQTKKLYVIGHRGSAGLAPENTLAAFRRACQIGVDGLELDVLLTADRKVVVHHDFSLKPEIARTPNGKWLKQDNRPAIKNLKLAELKIYDVGRLRPYTRYSRRYPEQSPIDGERIPTLREVISTYKNGCDPETQIWVEIKTSPEKPEMTPAPEDVAEAVVQVLLEEKIAPNTLILSFDWRVLVYVQKITPDIPTVYLTLVGRSLDNIKPGQPGPSPWTAGIDVDEFNGSIPRAVNAAGGRYWAPYYKHVTSNLVQEAQQLGLQVFVWTPDARSDMERLIKMGVNGIITNRPDILKSVLHTFE
jgi:glycerophosphoryl diester phosphodiesterase